jgi:hypothetical protein
MLQFLAESYALWDKPVHELCSTNAAVAAACGLAQHSHSWRIIQVHHVQLTTFLYTTHFVACYTHVSALCLVGSHRSALSSHCYL